MVAGSPLKTLIMTSLLLTVLNFSAEHGGTVGVTIQTSMASTMEDLIHRTQMELTGTNGTASTIL